MIIYCASTAMRNKPGRDCAYSNTSSAAGVVPSIFKKPDTCMRSVAGSACSHRTAVLSLTVSRSDVVLLSGTLVISIARGDTHDAMVDDNRVLRVDPHRLSGADQCHLAPRKTNLNLGIFDDPVLAAVRPTGFLYLQFIRLGIRVLKCCSPCRDSSEKGKHRQKKDRFFHGGIYPFRSWISRPDPQPWLLCRSRRRSPVLRDLRWWLLRRDPGENNFGEVLSFS
jgi:hypothetical protein